VALPARANRSIGESLSRNAILAVLVLAFVVRLAQLTSAMQSPLTYQPGPDEDYYSRFAQAVVAGHGAQYSPEFTFMDPAYGYILAAIFAVVGPNLFVVYLLQVLLDTATAYGIVTIGRLLGRPKAGLLGAVLYALTATAVMFCTTLLKEVWVTAYLTWWVVGALALIGSKRKWAWLLFGVYCGLGVGLRSTLLVVCLAAVLLPLLGAAASAGNGNAATGRGSGLPAHRTTAAALILCGIALGMVPWSLRNHAAYDSLSPLPHNGGIILQQIYNDQNPNAEIWIPPFVSYLHPSEIWRGYSAEAVRRAGHALTPPQVDRYWRDQAVRFIVAHPAQVLAHMLHKSLGWLSSNELANNRSYAEERMFSPLLAWLPAPAPWLLGMGLAGLVWLALEDRRWPIIAVPILAAWLTMTVFFAESRFRVHAAPELALCAGVWITQIERHLRAAQHRRQVAAFAAAAVAIMATSIWLGARTPAARVSWDRIAWGYINMGRITQAEGIAERAVKEQPDNAAAYEALAFTAIARQQYSAAAQALQRAIELRPSSHVAHYNLARVYLKLGDRERAAREAQVAATLNPAPEYQELVRQIAAGS
jgi:hypothetical protein